MAGTDVSSFDCHGLEWSSNFAAMVQRVPIETNSNAELKPAAAMAEAGGFRNILDTLWSSRDTEDGSLVRQVHRCTTSAHREANPVRRKMNIWLAKQGRHLLYQQTSSRTHGPWPRCA